MESLEVRRGVEGGAYWRRLVVGINCLNCASADSAAAIGLSPGTMPTVEYAFGVGRTGGA